MSGINSQKRFYGKYKNLKRYWGDEFVFNNDLTFNYKCHNKTEDEIEFTDSSTGEFEMSGDTIKLTYLSNNYHPFLSDSPKDSLRWQEVEPHEFFRNRPQKLYWNKKKIYYIVESTGQIIKSKEHYLSLVK